MAEFEGAVLIGSEVSEYPRIDIIHPEVGSMQNSRYVSLIDGLRSVKCVVSPLLTGYVLWNASLGDFVVVRTCTYTNLGSTVYPTTHLGYMV
jgi:hypothetical protein